MNPTPPYDDILEDETLAPLKRNHACLQCKKRKVKCDATKPTCAPCLRSHAHAVRSAHRNGTTPPVLTCTYAEADDNSPEPGPSEERSKVKKKKSAGLASTSPSINAGVKRLHIGQGRRETLDEEKEALKARIAELEARLSVMTPPSSHSAVEPSASIPSTFPDNMPFSGSFPTLSSSISGQNGGAGFSTLEEIGSGANASYALPSIGLDNSNNVPLPETLGDFSGLDDFFVVPKDWPKGLPLPFLLEHLVETFFNYVPQTPRMLHRATLLARIKLPPSSPDFPFPGLLHAICAAAATYTAWVNNLAPHLLEETVQRHLALGLDLTTVEDFGLAQAHLGSKAVDLTTSVCIMGSGPLIFQLTQTCILLGDVYFQKGFPMKGWMIGGQPARLLSVLELGNRQAKPKGYKEPLLRPAESDIEREERLVTTWMAFVVDAGFTINSNWAPSMALSETRCNLPTSIENWNKLGGMEQNPQHPASLDLYYSHPVEDSFVFVVKGSTLLAQVSSWVRNWQQREKQPDDELIGSKSDSFKMLNHSIEAFSTSLPAALKNIFRFLDQKSQGSFDANLLSIHLIPNIALCLLHEPFLQWLPYDPSTIATQRAYDGIMAILHLIPSNLDITLILTPFLALSLFTIGRFVSEFIKHATAAGQMQTALRYQADLLTLINLLQRYGQRHPLGNAMVHFLDQYVTLTTKGETMNQEDVCHFSTKRLTYLKSFSQEFDTNIDNSNDGENTEDSYLAKIRLHAEVAKNYPNSMNTANTNGLMQHLYPNSESIINVSEKIQSIPSGSRSNSIAGISPNTITSNSNSNQSNLPTPESVNSLNFNTSNCDMSVNNLLDLEGGSSGSGSKFSNEYQLHQQNTNFSDNNNNRNISINDEFSTNISGTTTRPNSMNDIHDQWDKTFHPDTRRFQQQNNQQLPLMTFLGNLGTSDSVEPLPIPKPDNSIEAQNQYQNPAWTSKHFVIPQVNQ